MARGLDASGIAGTGLVGVLERAIDVGKVSVPLVSETSRKREQSSASAEYQGDNLIIHQHCDHASL